MELGFEEAKQKQTPGYALRDNGRIAVHDEEVIVSIRVGVRFIVRVKG